MTGDTTLPVTPDWSKLSPDGKRERLVRAADTVFVEIGLDATVPAIAERAGAGIGSVYRQFHSKLDLIEAVVIRRLALIERVAAETGRSDDPAWPELVGMVWTVVARQMAAGYFAEAWDRVADREEVRVAWRAADIEFARLMARCREQEAVRPDASADDIWLILASARGAVRYEPGYWRRTVTLMLDGLQA
jgi:AcrR family transcriptional regulator